VATFTKRQRKRGARWTARVRINGREVTKTWPTKAAAETWARAQETAIETGEFVETGRGLIFADLVDVFTKHRQLIKRPLGKTGGNTLTRLKDEHGLEPASTLTASFWRKHVLKRMAAGAASQTAVGDLAYAGAVLAHAKREDLVVDASGPAEARAHIADEGLRINSRARERRISDDELDALLAACDGITSSVPLGAIVRFALATSMRRGEILRIRRTDVNESERVLLIRNRKHPTDRDRVDESPLMPAHPQWPRWDALEIIKAQPKGEIVFPYQGDTVGERFEKACEVAKLGGVVFHLLRHESLSRYAEHRKFDPLRLQLIGGHRDLRHVARYAKLSARGLARE
jgi:integrase